MDNNKAQKVIFLNVVKHGTKDDAILVDCEGKYVLIDGDPKTHQTKFREASVKHGKKESNKIVLQAVVITHYHPDHYGRIKCLLDNQTQAGFPEIVI